MENPSGISSIQWLRELMQRMQPNDYSHCLLPEVLLVFYEKTLSLQLFASTLKHISNIYGYYCNFIFYLENLITRSSAEDHPVWLWPRFFTHQMFVWDTPALRNLSPGDLNIYQPFSSVYLGQILQCFPVVTDIIMLLNSHVSMLMFIHVWR